VSRYSGAQGKGAARRFRENRRAATRPAAAKSSCPTGKRMIPTEQEARAELVGTVIRKNRGNQNRQECRWYLCPLCDTWHLTSKPEGAH